MQIPSDSSKNDARIGVSNGAHEDDLCSVVIPVYGNEASLSDLFVRLTGIADELENNLEVIFVIDGSPDDSLRVLVDALPTLPFRVELVEHSRNFGSFAAIRTGLNAAHGQYVGVMAADLQEPPELMIQFFKLLRTGNVDITVGRRESRNDPRSSRLSSALFWRLYRTLIFPEMPEGGVDIFACNRSVLERVLELTESHSSLVGLLYWVGFRRVEVPYSRQERTHGKSGWSTPAKVRYLLDSVFSFTDLPLTLLIGIGAVGGTITVLASIAVLVSFIAGAIPQPGYTPLMLLISFSTFSMLLALGIVGSYVWRSFENTKRRPSSIVMRSWTSRGSST